MFDPIHPDPAYDPASETLALLRHALSHGMGPAAVSPAEDPFMPSSFEAVLDLLSRRSLAPDERYAILAAFVTTVYVKSQALAPHDLVGLVRSLKEALSGTAPQPALHPAVPIEQSVTGAHIICLEDGHACKSLQRYLKRRFNMSPHAYRQRWGLPADYPMVAPDYSRCRAELARAQHLGRYVRKKADG